MHKIFLGGTCANSNWRKDLIAMLNSNIVCVDPTCANYKFNKNQLEDKHQQLQEMDYQVYVITAESSGFIAIARAVEYSNKMPEKLIFAFLLEYEGFKFENHLLESCYATSDIIKDNGVKVFSSLPEIAEFLNKNLID